MKSKLKKSLSLLLALVMAMSCMSVGAFANPIVPKVSGESQGNYTITHGEDTYTDLYQVVDGFYQSGKTYTNSTDFYITSKAGLKYFRDFVNGIDQHYLNGDELSTFDYSNNVFSGKTVHLCTDIDLTGEQWVPIGYFYNGGPHTIGNTTIENTASGGNGGKWRFYGNFDGGNHTVSNLTFNTATEAEIASEKAYNVGFFGAVMSPSTIKDLTISNVTLVGGNRVGAIAGGSYYGVQFENCTVTGNISVSGTSTIGGIVGYGGSAVVTDCEVNGTGTISGEAVVGSLIGYGANNTTGSIVDSIVGSDITVTEDSNSVTKRVGSSVALVNDIEYPTLEAAFAAVQDSETVKLLDDVALDVFVVIGDDKDFTLDLNGHTITNAPSMTLTNGSYNGNSGIPARFAIVLDGKLEIKDSGTGGKISFPNQIGGTTKAIVVEKNGKLTMTSGTVEADYAAIYVVGNTSVNDTTIYSPELVVNGGTLVGGSCAICAKGLISLITINDGVIGNGTTGSAISFNGTTDWYDAGHSKLIINGGTLTGTEGAVYLPAMTGEAVFNGGTINGSVLVKGGTLNIPANSTVVVNATAAYAEPKAEQSGATNTGDAIYVEDTYFTTSGQSYNPQVTIAGGSFSSAHADSVRYFTLTDKPGTGSITITGGTFDNDVSAYVAAGYEATESNGTWTVKAETAKVAEIEGGASYETLAEAIANVTDNKTIKLLDNVTLSEKLVIDNGKAFTLDLGGHTLTGPSGRTFDLNNAFVTVKNGTMTGSSQPWNVYGSNDSSYATGSYNSLTIENDVTVNGKYAVILWYPKYGDPAYGTLINVDGATLNGNIWVLGTIAKGNSEINVKSGTHISVESSNGDDAVGIALQGYATVNVEDGVTISAPTGIEVAGGILNVNGGTITGTASPTSVTAVFNGTTTVGAGIAVAPYGYSTPTVNIRGGAISGYTAFNEANVRKVTNAFKTPAISIEGGTFTVNSGGEKVVYSADGLTGFITGGKFNTLPDNGYIAFGYAATGAEDGYYTVSKAETTIATTKTEDEVTTAEVKISGTTAATVEVKVADVKETAKNATATTASILDVNVSSVIEKAITAGKIESKAGNETNTIELIVKADDESVAEESVTYEVDPYAIVNGDAANPVKLSNSDLNTTASSYQGFTFSVPAPSGVANGEYVKVVHSWEEDENHATAGYEDLGNIKVVNNKVTVTLKTFSSLSLTKSTEFVPEAYEGNLTYYANFVDDAGVYLNLQDSTYLNIPIYVNTNYSKGDKVIDGRIAYTFLDLSGSFALSEFSEYNESASRTAMANTGVYPYKDGSFYVLRFRVYGYQYGQAATVKLYDGTTEKMLYHNTGAKVYGGSWGTGSQLYTLEGNLFSTTTNMFLNTITSSSEYYNVAQAMLKLGSAAEAVWNYDGTKKSS